MEHLMKNSKFDVWCFFYTELKQAQTSYKYLERLRKCDLKI